MANDTDREIKLLIDSRSPILSIASHEEWRVVDRIISTASEVRKKHASEIEAEAAQLHREAEERGEKGETVQAYVKRLFAAKYQVLRWTVTDGLYHWSHQNAAGKWRPRPVSTEWMGQDQRRRADPLNPVDVLVSLRFPPTTLVPTTSVEPDDPEPGGVDLRTAIVVFCDLHHWLDRADPASRFNLVLVRALRDWAYAAKHRPAPSALIFLSPRSVVPVELEKEIQVIDYPLPTLEEREARFNERKPGYEKKYGPGCVNLTDSEHHQLMRALSGLTEDEADGVIEKSFANNGKLEGNDIVEVLREKQQIIKKDGTLEYFENEKSMADVGGLTRLRTWLSQRKRALAAEQVEYEGRSYPLPLPKGILMIGVPGGGKSLVAKAVAKEWGLPLLRLDIGRIFGGLVGQSEENMRRAIGIAKSMAPACLWLDECEKAFPKNSGSTDSGTSLRVMNTFLTWLQEKREAVFVVATGNDIDGVPPELTRKGRFDEIFYVGLPNAETRKQILKIHLGGWPIGDIELDRLAKKSVYFTGAEIEQCVRDAPFLLPHFISTAPPLVDGEPESPPARALFWAMDAVVPLARRELRDGVSVVKETLDKAGAVAVPADDFEPPPVAAANAPPVRRSAWGT